jgi:hypothetical protein
MKKAQYLASVIHRHVSDYFDSGAVSRYPGFYYHRTLEDYLDAFLAAGLRLAKLSDLPGMAGERPPPALLPADVRFPRFMLLAFR